ncbi:MAG TPA: PDZ domain-containing protein [Bacillota bacterium]|nr:PDZ domain-containing protein [Peptococcaceae bacterium]HPZ43615.1 PDZ domain-containing protein [Bacillota bacterium]HQD76125.1 PDZ domain-containing protein [Bacillota bacterium]HUM58828.1 PDZ domain-containing protein [Bacillota bacterium]
MFPFAELLPLILNSFLQAFLNLHFLPLFLMVMLIIAMQYRRMEKMRESFYGRGTGRTWHDLFVAAGLGLVGGLLGSYLMIFIGLTLSESGLIYLWPVAILLMLINMRFLCFSYAGGLLALASLLFGFPDIKVPQILALVAILHLVESFLIFSSGHLGAVPAYIKGPGGRITGGFTLQKFWPIPLVVLAVIAGGSVVEGGIEMPGWWPLLKPGVPGDPQTLTYIIMPVVAALGYGDLTIARTPLEKSRLSALYLSIYSLVLLILAVLSEESRSFALAAALFSFLGHEAVIYIGRGIEFREKPLYVPPEQGVRVLDVLPDGPAWRAGIRSGDVLLAIDGVNVENKMDLANRLQGAVSPLTVDYWSHAAAVQRRALMNPPRRANLWGIVPVPEGQEHHYLEMMTTGSLGRWLQQAWRNFIH